MGREEESGEKNNETDARKFRERAAEMSAPELHILKLYHGIPRASKTGRNIKGTKLRIGRFRVRSRRQRYIVTFKGEEAALVLPAASVALATKAQVPFASWAVVKVHAPLPFAVAVP